MQAEPRRRFRNRTNAIIFNRATIVSRYIDARGLASTTFEPDIIRVTQTVRARALSYAPRICTRDTRDRKHGNAGSVSDKSIPGYGSIRLREKCAIYARAPFAVRAVGHLTRSPRFTFQPATFLERIDIADI